MRAACAAIVFVAACASIVRAADGTEAKQPASGEQPAAQQKKQDGSVKAPRIVFDARVHDFGDSAQNSRLKHTFAFKNSGGAELDIQKVKSG